MKFILSPVSSYSYTSGSNEGGIDQSKGTFTSTEMVIYTTQWCLVTVIYKKNVGTPNTRRYYILPEVSLSPLLSSKGQKGESKVCVVEVVRYEIFKTEVYSDKFFLLIRPKLFRLSLDFQKDNYFIKRRSFSILFQKVL